MVAKNDVLNAINGDNQAMEHLYNATYQKLRAVTVSILKNEDDAEDIIQESYIKAFSNLHQLEDAEKFEGWLCRIASNKCKDYLKKHKPVLFSDLNNSDDEDEDPFEWSIEDDSKDYNPEEVAISDDTRRQLMELVNSLPDEQRICLVYYAVEEMKISEIAELLEVPEATVKSRLKYAKDKMKNKIEDLEKKGVKIRGLSGLAVIPFLRYIFAIEAKAAALGSFAVIAKAVGVAGSVTGTTVAANVIAEGAKTVITEVAKQAGTKAAVGLGAKIASIPLVTKIVAGVVAIGAVVTSSIATYYATTDSKDTLTYNVEESYNQSEQSMIDKLRDARLIEKSMDAYFKVVIEGYVDLEFSSDMITDEVRETMLKAAPENAWWDCWFANQEQGLDWSLMNYLGLYREYVRGYYLYNVGEDYKITYEITSQSQLSESDRIALDEKMSETSATEGCKLDSDYVKEQSKYRNFYPAIEKGALENAYKITVKYTASGSKTDWIREGEYIAIKTGGDWYITKNGVYSIFWDRVLTDGMSGAWHP